LNHLETRRNNISRSFFQDIFEPNSCLYHLIPSQQNTSVTTRLRPQQNTSVTTRLRRTYHSSGPFTHQKILFSYKFWPTSLPINKVTPSYSTWHIPLTAQCTHA